MSDLIADRLRVRLGDKQVLADVSAAMDVGRVTALVGPNGAGKSTFLECLAGLRRPDSGEVRLTQAILGLAPRERSRRIGYLPQTPEIAWEVDVTTFVGLGRTPYIGAWGLSAEDRAAVARAIVTTRLEAFETRLISTLSGGERARALIARALAGQPEWLLADEPLAGLDPRHALDAADLFRRMAHEEGRGVVVTLHDLGAAMRIADRVLVLAGGRILADGTPAQALTPEILAQAYGIAARLVPSASGVLVEIMGRAG